MTCMLEDAVSGSWYNSYISRKIETVFDDMTCVSWHQLHCNNRESNMWVVYHLYIAINIVSRCTEDPYLLIVLLGWVALFCHMMLMMPFSRQGGCCSIASHLISSKYIYIEFPECLGFCLKTCFLSNLDLLNSLCQTIAQSN